MSIHFNTLYNMKKVLILFTVLLFAIAVKALPVLQDFPEYRIPNYVTVEEMQALIGKTYFYYPSVTKFALIKDDSFLTGMFGDDPADVTFLSVEGKTKKGKPSNKMDITVSVKSEKATNIIHFIYYSGNYDKKYSSYKNEFTYNELRLMELEKWKAANSSIIGTEFSDPLVKHTYKVVDIELKNDYNLGKLRLTKYLVLESGLDGSRKSYTEKNAKDRCFANDKSGRYHTYLAKVEKPSNPAVKFGETKTISTDEKNGATKYSYVDNFIDILIYGTSEQFYFTLKNISANTQKLIWDEAVFVDYNGSSSKIMHNGIKYSQKEAAQPASTIIKGASIDELACPISNVYYSETGKEWRIKSMYPNPTDNKQVQLMLPIQIKDVTNEYIFVFDLKYEFNHPERLNLTTE